MRLMMDMMRKVRKVDFQVSVKILERTYFEMQRLQELRKAREKTGQSANL